MTDTDTFEPTPIERTPVQEEHFEQAIKDKVDELLVATRECFAIVGRPQYFQPDLLRIAYDVLDLDPALVEGGWETLGFRWSREINPTWGLKTSLRVEFSTPYRSAQHDPTTRDFEERVKVDVSWPSGGGDPARAVAEASQHLEMAQWATRVQMVYQRAVRPPESRYGRLAKGDPARVIDCALGKLHAMRERALGQISDHMKEQSDD